MFLPELKQRKCFQKSKLFKKNSSDQFDSFTEHGRYDIIIHSKQNLFGINCKVLQKFHSVHKG